MELERTVYKIQLFSGYTCTSEMGQEVLKHVKWKPTRFTGFSLSKRLPHLFHNMSIRRTEKLENGLETTVQI